MMGRIEDVLLSILTLVLGIPGLFFGAAALMTAPSPAWALFPAVAMAILVTLLVIINLEIWS